jgi:hypothetical protein
LLINFAIQRVAAAATGFLLKKSETRECVPSALTAKRVLPVVVIILIKNIFHRAKEHCGEKFAHKGGINLLRSVQNLILVKDECAPLF